MILHNNCEKCPYYNSYIPYWSEDGCPVETCGAGLNAEDGCRHSLLVRWILAKIQSYKDKKLDEYMMSLLESEEKEEQDESL